MVNLDDLKKEARRVLKDGKVKYIIGYTQSTAGNTAAPTFITDPDKIDDLIWDPTCVHNLVKFLVDEKHRKSREKNPDTRPVGIVVKGCDSRAVNVLLQEKFIEREDAFVLGVSCEDLGVIDEAKLADRFRGMSIQSVEFDGSGHAVVNTNQGTTKVPVQEILADRCVECQAHYPVVYDVFLGEKTSRKKDEPFKSLEELESKTGDQRWKFWQEQLNKCVRCYACRSACPMCYCDECVADTIVFAVTADTTSEEKAQKIKWVEKSPDSSENFGYHLVRAIHLAGRCIDCGECERVCPVAIPLRYLNKKLEKSAKELFDYTAGFETDKPALVASFKDEDPEDFIR